MREIKFRAWDKENKKMRHFDDFWLCGEYQSIAFSLTKKESDEQEGTYCLDFMQDDLSPLMQYTGIKDRNGVEVYEGDIVLIDYGNPDYEQYKEIINDIRKDCNFDKEVVYKVIGNIYENPELMEVKND